MKITKTSYNINREQANTNRITSRIDAYKIKPRSMENLKGRGRIIVVQANFLTLSCTTVTMESKFTLAKSNIHSIGWH